MDNNSSTIDPTDVETSSVIIDPETITQWVDKKLSLPHQKSIDILAEKFSCLKNYKKDVEEYSALLKKNYPSKIQAPAHTVLRVMQAIEEEEKDVFSSQKDTLQTDEESLVEIQKSELSSLAENKNASCVDVSKAAPTQPFFHPTHPFQFNIDELQVKKSPKYILPIAAILLLGGLIMSVVLIDANKQASSEKFVEESDQEEGSSPLRKHSRRDKDMDTTLNREDLQTVSQQILTSGEEEQIIAHKKELEKAQKQEPLIPTVQAKQPTTRDIPDSQKETKDVSK